LGDLRDIYVPSSRGLEVFFLNTPINFFPENNDLGGGFYAQADLLASNFKNRDPDVVSDEEAFAGFSRENQQGYLPGYRYLVL
jgi:hypothetical protein